MKAFSPATQAALEARAVRARDFIWFVAKTRDTGAPVPIGYWSDVGPVTAEVLNPETGLAEARSFDGAGTLISVGAIPQVANLTVQTVEIALSQVSDADRIMRQYEPRQGRVEIYRGLFHAGSMIQLEPAYCRFFGFIDQVDIGTPAEGGEGAIVLSCVSHSQELLRSNPATRSDADLRRRNPSDSFRRHVAVVDTWEIRWGENDPGAVPTQTFPDWIMEGLPEGVRNL